MQKIPISYKFHYVSHVNFSVTKLLQVLQQVILFQEQQVDETEESSSFAKIAGTVAFIALGAALVAMVLRKQSL